jgi:hypothetical protein
MAKDFGTRDEKRFERIWREWHAEFERERERAEWHVLGWESRVACTWLEGI